MYLRLDRIHRAAPVFVGVISLAAVLLLFTWDAAPGLFPAGSHRLLSAAPLTAIALAYLIYQAAHRPPAPELLKAILLAVAFLFWAANQYWPELPQATLFNDIAIALFVLDIFLVMIGWPTTSPDQSFGESYVAASQPPGHEAD